MRFRLFGLFEVLALFGWSLFVRLPTFLRTVIDWDESLYLLMADAWQRGALPYIALWDHKPIGTYFIFRVAIIVIGRSVFAMRLTTVVFVATAALLVRALTIACTGHRAAATMAAIAYPAFSLGMLGTASNTEHFFIVFELAGGVALARLHASAVDGAGRLVRLAAAGLAFGVALQIKYIAIFDVSVLVAVFLVAERARPRPAAVWGRQGVEMLVLGVAMSAPTILAGLYFRAHGYGPEFVDANFSANLRHATTLDSREAFHEALVSLRRWAKWSFALWIGPAVAMVVHRIRPHSPHRGSGFERALVVWLVAGLLEAAATRQFYLHYYLVTLPPLCLLATLTLTRRIPWCAGHPVPAALTLSILPLFFAIRSEYARWIEEYRVDALDAPARVAEYIGHVATGTDEIFVVDAQPIIYFLSGIAPPTKFAFPPFLMDPHFSTVARVNYQDEIRRVLDERPKCLVFEANPKYERATEVRAMAGRAYSIEQRIGEFEVVCRP